MKADKPYRPRQEIIMPSKAKRLKMFSYFLYERKGKAGRQLMDSACRKNE
jgi:hypothetical protein